ncbi:MAG: superoxide dismutase [Ni] [Planctomycetota bacterium]
MHARSLLAVRATLAFVIAAVFATPAAAHCQVPCGIFGDQRQFEKMLEDAETIKKSMTLIVELSGKSDPQSVQQLVRWVNNKEKHARAIQYDAMYYFLAQRVKLPKDEAEQAAYQAKVIALHEIIVYAMRCKQTTDTAAVTTLVDAVQKFRGLYFDESAEAHLKQHAEGHSHEHTHTHADGTTHSHSHSTGGDADHDHKHDH